MQKLNVKTIFYALWVLFFTSASFIVIPALKKRDIYPFFKWSLFGNTQRYVEDYTIQVLSINNQSIDNCYISNCKKLNLRSPKDSGLYSFAQDWGKNLKAPEKFETYKEHMDTIFLARYEKAEYNLIKRRYDLLKRPWGEHVNISQIIRKLKK